jgi:hypothetical protein
MDAAVYREVGALLDLLRAGLTHSPAQVARAEVIVRGSTAEERAERIEKAGGAESPWSYFSALFEADGRARPMRSGANGQARGLAASRNEQIDRAFMLGEVEAGRYDRDEAVAHFRAQYGGDLYAT